MTVKVVISFLFGSLIRIVLFYSGFSPILQKRVEVSTPMNSWENVQEGLYLMRKNITPYSGDTFHETPLMLVAADALSQLPVFLFYGVFILCDLLTAINLAAFVDEAKAYFHVEESADLKIQADDNYGEVVLMCYVLSPFTILNCLALTTTVFGNFLISLAILDMIKGQRLLSSVALAAAVLQSLYPISLIFPLILCIHSREVDAANKSKVKGRPPSLIVSALKSVTTFALALGGLFYACVVITGDYVFVERIYGFILSVPDLKPNIGLFWYFFTEMFEHFHLLFICTFQINAFIYFVPLTIRFRQEPTLLVYTFLAIITIFKSYPCAGDLGLYMALIPMWKHLAPFMQQKFIVACFFIATTVLAPVQWYLWIYSGSANANFYFGVTIALGTAQIFLLTDVLLSYLKREYYLANGMCKEIDGKPARLALH